MVRDFSGFCHAGRKLADLHVGYGSVEPFALEEVIHGFPSGDGGFEFYQVQKMAFGKGKTAKEKDRSRIVYNSRITLAGIPEDAYRYQLGSRSAVEWIMDRFRVTVDKPSGIVKDPNDWAVELGDPRYILDLLKRIVTVSVETMKIVDALPPLDIIEAV
jgi:predicted helicase